MSDIVRRRGDTYRIRRYVKTAAGAVVNITDWIFKLTINKEAAPVDAIEQVAQIAGVIQDAPNGVVDFPPQVADVDWIGINYFDIEAIDSAGEKSTLDDGQFILIQDKTK